MKNKLLNSLAGFLLFLTPASNYSQATWLGSDTTFAAFTIVGAFDNFGLTVITGDVGTNAGGFTGFPPGTYSGSAHVADTESAQAAADLTVANNYITALVCDTAISGGLGSLQVLTPKIYCIATAASVTGDLILDGGGNPNAGFIFKVGGALTSAPFSQILLINGADFCNVFWQIDGAVVMGDNSLFSGTMIVNGAITLNDLSTLSGRALSIAGAINITNSTINGCLTSGSLPIKLVSFIARPVGAEVLLEWATASESNNGYFAVQRSRDAISFQEVLRVPGAGVSTSMLHYSAIDKSPFEGSSYYRLMQRDNEGAQTFSEVVMVNAENQFDFEVYPNPFSGSATLIANDFSPNQDTEMRIYNNLGAQVMHFPVIQQATAFETGSLPAGNYFFRVYQDDKFIQGGKLVSMP